MRDIYVNMSRRRQASRQTRGRVLIVVVSALIIVACSLLLGHYLQGRVAALSARDAFPAELLSGQLPADTSDASEVSIMASDLAVAPLTDSAAIARMVEELRLGSREAVSLSLRGASGDVTYRSQVAQNLTGQAQSGVDLPALLSALRTAGIYSSAVFSVTSFGENDAVSRELLRAYELSLCAEIGGAGADELLLLDLPVTVDTLDETVSFLDEVRGLLPTGVSLAVAVPRALIEQASGTVLVKQLSLSVDTVALDLRDLAAGEKADLSAAAGAVFAEASLYFSKYNMRVLLAPPDDDAFTALRQTLEVNAIQNWQIVK